jgi:hypothetical protein
MDLAVDRPRPGRAPEPAGCRHPPGLRHRLSGPARRQVGAELWIEDVMVLRLVDDDSLRRGQAATYRQWRDA